MQKNDKTLDELDILFEQDRFNPYADDAEEDVCPDDCPCDDCMDLEDFISNMIK